MSSFNMIVFHLLLFLVSLRQQIVAAVVNNNPVICPLLGRVFVGQNRLDTADPIKPVGELSGLALSPTQVGPTSGSPLLFAIGDGGSLERIGIWDSATGERLLSLRLDNNTVINKDWEGVTMGSCGITGPQDTCLYVMDGGDNTAKTSSGSRSQRDGGDNEYPYSILKIREPKIEDFQDNEMIPKSYYSILEYNYMHPTSPTIYADCETIFLDHAGWGGENESIGDIYLVPKWEASDTLSKNRLFKIPVDAWPDTYCASRASYSPQVIGSYQYKLIAGAGIFDDPIVSEGQLMGSEWRTGEMSFDGTMIGLGTNDDAFVFLRCPGASVVDTLAGSNASSKACARWPHPASGQVEAFSFSPDGTHILTASKDGTAKLWNPQGETMRTFKGHTKSVTSVAFAPDHD